MTAPHSQNLHHEFRSSSAKPKAKHKKRIPPISVRFSADERAWLEDRASGQSLSGYIRDAVLDDDKSKRRKRKTTPIRDYQALARLLGMLGRSEIGSALCGILLAIELGRLELENEVEDELRQACGDIAYMRNELITALGLQSEGQ
ncbi:hypothetical protein FIV00_00145 [Labrenzia sp. THAF82]|uniref:hypothetical protein n=1 Tax=Labrenzia sp. THAF82 TaxID=2587861 RepID=UPI001268541E|nr:hypothetical protein [Labrenzia sp. THAF82]QFT28884.1 hypothetical protein FIV00_00145 [Labrenzia sp. THAF82]